ncbi:hypothetical protein MKD07_14100, partial [[Clostridium] innocuum]|nr:hypothetical protein [[Clostridium] innocuum]
HKVLDLLCRNKRCVHSIFPPVSMFRIYILTRFLLFTHLLLYSHELWSTAMAIQMGEARYRYGLEDSYEEGMKEGIIKGKEEGKIEGEKVGIHKGRIEGKISLLLQQLDSKYHEDCSVWLFSLNDEQIENVSSLILTCNTLQELKDQVMISQ